MDTGRTMYISECFMMVSVFMCDVQLYGEHYNDIINFFQSDKSNRHS